MSLVTRIQDLATRVATECKSIRTLVNGNTSDLSALNTTAKGNLVAAVNELKAAVDSVAAASGAPIDDLTTDTGTTWSSTKISTEITGALNGVLDGAPAALDTLNELAAAISDDANFAATTTTALGNRVRTDTATQGLNATQQGNARANIDAQDATSIGDPDTNYVTTFNAGLL